MKARDSGMPEEGVWETFFDARKIIKTMIDDKVRDAADFGCGYGTFTIPAAKSVNGKVYAIDINPEMIEVTKRKARENGLNNVKTILRDFISNGTGLGDESVDYVMLFNILHAEEPEKLLGETYRILKGGGKLGIIHWVHDPSTPRGPPMEIRPTPEKCIQWAGSAGFSNPQRYELKPYHYGIVMEKPQQKRVEDMKGGAGK